MFILRNTNLMTLTAPVKEATRRSIDLNEMLVRHPRSTFFRYSKSSSMTGAFIPPGALLLIDTEIEPKNSDIVLAEVNGRCIIRFLKKNKYTAWLCNASVKYQEIKITPARNVVIRGVVTYIISRPPHYTQP